MTERICTECGRKALARGLCRTHYNRAWSRGVFDVPSRTLSDVSPSEVRDALSRRCCPLCGSGPFAHVLSHAAKKHAVSAREIKLHAGLTLQKGHGDELLVSRLSEAYADNTGCQAAAVNLDTYRAAAVEASRSRRTENPTFQQYRSWWAAGAVMRDTYGPIESSNDTQG